jgi:hypothetical protein
MGNVMSEEPDTSEFLEEGFKLNSPDADEKINFGTAAPIWQNKKAMDAEKEEQLSNRNSSNGAIDLLADNNGTSIGKDGTSFAKSQGGNDNNNKNNQVAKLSSRSRQESGISESGTSNDSSGNDQQQGSSSRIQQGANNNNNSTSSMNSTDSQNSNNPKKMSYLQMAKVGYQELVNAIIRPPRCDYKVRFLLSIPLTYMAIY